MPLPRILLLVLPQITLSPFGKATGHTGHLGQGCSGFFMTLLIPYSFLCSSFLFSCALAWVLHGLQSAHGVPAVT